MAEEKQRTLQQNRALHIYCKIMSEKLNECGQSQKAVLTKLNENFDIPWTEESFKCLFREVATLLYSVESTAELSTKELQEVYKVVDARISEITGVREEFPSVESMLNDW